MNSGPFSKYMKISPAIITSIAGETEIIGRRYLA